MRGVLPGSVRTLLPIPQLGFTNPVTSTIRRSGAMPQQKVVPTERNAPSRTHLLEPGRSERIDNALQKMAIRLDKVLSESVINQFHEDCGSYPLAAIEYAADWCGKNLERWPKFKQFAYALGSWMQQQEESPGQVFIPSHHEIMQQRKKFMEWYNSPEAAEIRGMVRALDQKMNQSRPRLYTQEQLAEFRRKRR
jgi:hypothetical protein